MDDKKLFLLDVYALIFRAYYALIRAPRFTSGGFNTSAIFGFVNTLHEILKKEQPTHIAVCFDPPGPTFRHEAYERYKAEREATPEDIKLSVPVIKDIIAAYNIPIMEVPGYEADDVIATLAVQAEAQGFTTYMMTPDKDFGQLVTDNIKIYKPAYKGGEYEIRGVKEICERYHLQSPSQVIDLLALMGDKVDNIPGCPGVGEVTAEKLIAEFGSVENLLENTDKLKGALKTKVEANVESIRFSKFLATIKTDVPVKFNEEEFRRHPMNPDALRAIFERLEFRSLISRIIPAATSSAPADTPRKPASPQLSLFDFSAEENAATETAPIETIKTQFGAKPQSYIIADSTDKITTAVTDIIGKKEFSFHTVASGSEAMTATLHGIAIATCENAYYFPLDGNARDYAINAITPLLESNTLLKIGTNIKYDSIILRRLGINLNMPYCDIAVAHYIIQPEQPHTLERLAEVYLNYALPPESAIFDSRAKQNTLRPGIEISAICDYACTRAAVTAQLYTPILAEIESLGMLPLLNEIETPLIEVLADMEYTGVLIDTDVLKAYSKILTVEMNRIEAECHELAGEVFNTASPMQVGEILFDKLRIDPNAKRTRTGQYSTTEEILSKLADKHPLVSKILELRSVRKLLTTYVNALPDLINPKTGRIHTTYNQTVTATGRLSSTNPNLQNIPIRNEDGKEIRRAFIPSPGNCFFSADYSQIELRLAADISNDNALISAFLSDKDIHRATAAKIYNTSPELVTDDMRRHAKTANFGILYGISAFGLAQRLNISRSQAKELIDGYMAAFPGIRDFIDRNIAIARQQGYITTEFGRRRQLPDINSRNAVVRSFSERNAVNAPIQGTAADIIKIAMVRIFARFRAEGIKSKMTMQVHDELNFDVLPEELEAVTKIVNEEMCGAYSSKVPLTVSSGAGKNWLEAH